MKCYWIILIDVFIFLSNLEANKFVSFDCCNQVLGLCQQSCQNLSLAELGALSYPINKDQKINNLRKLCPSTNLEFWNCMNNTFQAVSRGLQWAGRPCCSLGISLMCQNTCAVSSSKSDIEIGCRKSDEQSLFSCVERQEIGDECCGNARTSECLRACKDLYRSNLTPTEAQTNYALKVCNDSNTIVPDCIKKLAGVKSNVNLKQYLPCCEKSNDEMCRTTCENSLLSSNNPEQVIDEMQIGGCGVLLPYDPLWQCFLSSGKTIMPPASSAETSRISQIGMDSAKLHCCNKASSSKCRRLCTLTFSNDWTETQENFDIDCLSQITEINLRRCLDEVDEPCELGCNNMEYCTNFNNRPTDLFRSCTREADIAAKADVMLWQSKGILRLPGIELPFRNVTECPPEMWKTIGCMLQIRPCTSETHGNQICREDCFNILSKCLDWTKIIKGYTASSLCKKLSVDDNTAPCISIKPYLEPSYNKEDLKISVTSPCRTMPCNSSQICLVNRNFEQQKKFNCVPGCPLGEASGYHVPIGTYVRIPVTEMQNGCLKICKCGKSGRLEKCQPLPCITYDSCSMGGNVIHHGSWFYVECNVCSCYAGEITCTKKQCKIPGIEEQSFTGLPCNCPPHYVPVCGKNGMTYPSSCVAKCLGIHENDFTFGTCRSQNPCESHNCSSNSICIPDFQICLSVMHKPCHQYQCINLTTAFCNHHGEKVCDQNQRTHSSMCHLIKSKSQFDYHGQCIKGCSNTKDEPVCGINGITYKSECEAWSDYSLVDYNGTCREIGILSDQIDYKCSAVKCKSLSNVNCKQIIPPGACCPICSIGAKIVFSRKQIDRVLYALYGHEKRSISLKSILKSLENLIQIAQCRLVGYLTIETDIFISIHPTINETDPLMLKICNKETEKITTLISTQSHRMSSELGLSALTVANIIHPSTFNRELKININFIFLSFCLIILKILWLIQR